MTNYLDGVIVDQNNEVVSYQTPEGYVEVEESGGVILADYYYTVSDWLGSNRSIMDANGNVQTARDHYPFGKRMPARHMVADAEGNRFQYTGHEYDEETGYGYHGARYYNRELGRYMNVDPWQEKYFAWSSYNYTMNSPVNFIDPTGKGPTDWVQKEDGSIYWDNNAKSQETTKEGETYLSASYLNKAVVDAVGRHIMGAETKEEGYEIFLSYQSRWGNDFYIQAARHHYVTNASGKMKSLSDKYQSVKDGIRISQMTHSWVDEAGWTESRNELEHWIGMFVIASAHGLEAANMIGYGNEFRGLFINDRQSGNMINAMEGKSANGGGPTAFEWKDIRYNTRGIERWQKHVDYYSFDRMDLDGDGKLSAEENMIYRESRGGIGE